MLLLKAGLNYVHSAAKLLVITLHPFFFFFFARGKKIKQAVVTGEESSENGNFWATTRDRK